MSCGVIGSHMMCTHDLCYTDPTFIFNTEKMTERSLRVLLLLQFLYFATGKNL